MSSSKPLDATYKKEIYTYYKNVHLNISINHFNYSWLSVLTYSLTFRWFNVLFWSIV